MLRHVAPILHPAVPGKDLQGVMAYRDIADTQRHDRGGSSCKNAVVIGGGLLGLEPPTA